MTLDDIRARDAADIPITLDMTGEDWRRALWQVAADRRTLLGMLEPSAVPEHEPCCACCSEVDRLTEDRDYWENLAGHALPYPEKDVLVERARIAEAIKTLRHAMDGYSQERRLGFNEGLAAALALLEDDHD